MTKRINAGELTLKNKGQEVKLYGWVSKSRRMGSLIFADIRDRYGITQVVFSQDNDNFEVANKLRSEYVVEVIGKVIERKSKNKNIPTGDIEIEVSSLEILSKASQTPLIIADETDALENTRMKYRYLDLRRPSVQNKLIMRSKFNNYTRNFFNDNSFIEVETPILTKPTPEGARDFLIPSRVAPGKFFALPQSPQMYKQLLMISGIDKYFQIAKVFRDEDSRKDRQVEFTQLDVEMSFMNEQEVMNLLEKYIKGFMKEFKGIDFKEDFIKIDYDDALNKYGSDRPDIRYDLELSDGTELFGSIESDIIKNSIKSGSVVKYLKVDKKLSGKNHKELEEIVKQNGGKGLMFYSYDSKEKSYAGFLSKFLNDEIKEKFGEDTDYSILAVVAPWLEACELMGVVRQEVAQRYIEFDENQYKFSWIVNWPLFFYDKESKEYSSMHHPFTRPSKETEKFLDTDPSKVRSIAYDIVLNGSEIGGGSLRIFDQEMQKKVFEILGLTQEEIDEKFSFFIEAFKYGAPPHGGIAFGIDRIMQILTDSNSIREVIAFPKSTSGVAEMESAPTLIKEESLDELNIKFKK